MDSLETDDKLTIVNRSVEHRISKKLICKIPHFERMLSHECLESKENKVELDFDEKALKSFLNWLESGNVLIEMDFVINLCNMMDYFNIKDNLIFDNCADYFGRNFCSEYFPIIIPQVTSTSALIDSDTLDAFICRYFLKIANINVWLDYPIETIEYICALDLMIHSEYQVFDAINKWATFKADSRKWHLRGLLKLIRWCNLEDKDLSKIMENEFFRSLQLNIESCLHFNCKCSVDRTKQGNFIMLEKLMDNKLRVKVLDRNFMPFINQVIESDQSLPLNFSHGKHVSDIPFDSGRQMIRIDWKEKKYRLLDFYSYKSHCCEIFGFIIGSQKSLESCIEKKKIDEESSWSNLEFLLLEAAEKFILIRNDEYMFRCLENPYAMDIRNATILGYNCTLKPSIFTKNSNFHRCEHNSLATVLDKNVYVLTDKLEFFQFNTDRNLEFKNIGLQRFANRLNFDNLLLTCKQAGDDEVILLDKSTKDLLCFNVTTQRWKSIGRIIDSKSESNDLKTFTFGFVSTDSINLCLERKLTQ